jgi:hypothetical protein
MNPHDEDGSLVFSEELDVFHVTYVFVVTRAGNKQKWKKHFVNGSRFVMLA